MRLGIRTYAVTPLSEDCGLIEWVPNTTTLRNIVGRYYKSQGVSISASKIRSWKEKSGSKDIATFFTREFLNAHKPPVLHKWFLDNFTDPSSWLNSRLRWTRSFAVMSIVGFIVGLGDRHTENILVDEKNGQVVHVDFNCLFEKGISLEYPERVPFRLTQNVIDGFGVTGTDGVFVNCCQVTMKSLRNSKDTLMSVLETFIHDPLVEWGKRRAGVDLALQGRKVLNNINNKLEGGLGITYELNRALSNNNNQVVNAILTAAHGLDLPPTVSIRNLTVNSQVEKLIEEATNIEHLSRMWIGWSAYI